MMEVLLAAAISLLVMGVAFSVFFTAARTTRAGGYQVHFTAMGRAAAQKMTRYIERGKAVGVSSNGLDIIALNLTIERIGFLDTDNNISTVSNNFLVYYPNANNSAIYKTLCSHVRPNANEPLFCVIPASPNAARISFHVGDGTNLNDASFSGTGKGYQGLEIRFSATPRNLQRWYD